MLSSPGCPIENSAANVAVWKRIARCCKNFKARPYLVFNASVIGNHKDPQTQNVYREFLGNIIATIEEYCLVDQSAQFWDNLDRHVLGEDQAAVWRLCHLNIARQRVVIRLCPKQRRVNWGTHENTARTFFAETKVDKSNWDVDRDVEVEEFPSDEVISTGAEEGPGTSFTADDQNDEDETIANGEPSFETFWIHEDDLPCNMSCAKAREHDPTWNRSSRSCQNVNSCLFCAAAARLTEDHCNGYIENEAVAALMLYAKERG
jgi:hypothetical protein